jgi:hypothetical protein
MEGVEQLRVALAVVAAALSPLAHGRSPAGVDWQLSGKKNGHVLCLRLAVTPPGRRRIGVARGCGYDARLDWDAWTDCDRDETYLFGLVSARGARVEVRRDGRRTVTARVVRRRALGRERAWFAVVPGLRNVSRLRALDERGRTVERLYTGFRYVCGPAA